MIVANNSIQKSIELLCNEKNSSVACIACFFAHSEKDQKITMYTCVNKRGKRHPNTPAA